MTKNKNDLNNLNNLNHYDIYPFDYLTKEDEKNIKKKQEKPFIKFIEKYTSNNLNVAEIGCGPGRSTLYMTNLGLSVSALDLSSASLELAKKRAPKGNYFNGDNSNLPFINNSFDIVVSNGVLHHTKNPEISFKENSRILKEGGKMYLSIYRKYGKYYFIYHFLGFFIRKLERNKIGKLIIHKTFIPFYYIVHKLRNQNNITYKGARNLFYDYFITPIVFFKTKKEIIKWSLRYNLQLLKYISRYKNSHIFYFIKT